MAVAAMKTERYRASDLAFGRGTARSGNGSPETPLIPSSSTMQNLQMLLRNCSRVPSENLIKILESLNGESDGMTLETRVEQFVCVCTARFMEHRGDEDLQNMINLEDLAVTLYYKLLESIVVDETARLSRERMGALLAQDILHHALLAASFEVVIFTARDSHRQFPWILNTFSLAPFHFLRVIELIVRIEPDFPREVVSYLSRLEEQILESMAWEVGSPLWQKLTDENRPVSVPSCKEAFLPGQLEAMSANVPAADVGGPRTSQLLQHSPVPSSTRFRDPQSNVVIVARMPEDSANIARDDHESNVVRRVVRNSTNIDIFFRKFYRLAFVRLNCFGELLQRNALVQRTWTCFEHAIRHTQIMRGRHLDQILMCCIYIMCKATGEDLKFEEIMRRYRTQRNAASHIYRSVLIKNADREILLSPVENTDASTEDRGDIIKFYNSVFVETMRDFAEQFSGAAACRENVSLLLSPVPKLREKCVSPRKRVSSSCNVYVSPMKAALKPPRSPRTVQFHISLDQRFSPRSLQSISALVSPVRINGIHATSIVSPLKSAQKRLLTNDEPEPHGRMNGEGKFAKKLRSVTVAQFLPPPSNL